ncbi:MAG TPA: choice-of-anchor D domain-containing protein [Kofleriaceae bacterium]|nr:choice-of-anchor D domain-containing protein [Kofleriaceae bacterium]
MRSNKPALRLVALAIALILAIVIGAGDDGADASPHPAGGTGTGVGSDQGLIVAPTPLDFGGVAVGSNVGSNLSLTNTNTTLTVTIKSPLGKPITPDCAVFTVTPTPSLPDVIPAGATRFWTVQFKPTIATSYDCQWTLDDDDGNPDVVHLTGFGVTGHISVFPNPVDFGTQSLSSTTDLAVKVTNDGSGSIQVTGITQTSGNPPFSILNLPGFPVTLQPTESTQFTARFHPTTSADFFGNVRVDDNSPNSTGTNVQLIGTGSGSGTGGAIITMTPNPVDFGTVAVGGTGGSSVTVGNTGTVPLVVSSMSIAGSNATDFHFADTSLSCTSGQTCNTQFQVSPVSIPRQVALACSPTSGGARFATLSATSNASSGTSSVTLQCTGSAPMIGVSPPSISYGTIKVNTNGHANLTISNNGTSDLVVSKITFDGNNPADFAAQSCAGGCTIPASTSTIVDVTFTPPVRGVRTANLHVMSNDPARPDVAVGVDGVGGLPVMVITQPVTKTIDFGGIPVNTTSSTAPITVQNQGELTLNITNAGTSPPFAQTGPTAPFSLAPSTSATWNVTCHPTNAIPYSANFAIMGDDPSKMTDSVALDCQGINSNLNANPSPLSFGEVRTGGGFLKKTVTVTNTGALAVTINSAPITGSATFTDAVQGAPLPRTLNQNDQMLVDVTFAPTVDGHETGTLSLKDNTNTTAVAVALSGDGVTASYDVQPPMIDFGSRCVAQADNQDVVITNNGTAHISLVSTAISGGNGAFTIASGNVTSPIDLAPTASHTVSIVGTAASGASMADLVVTTDVGGKITTMVSLSITGTQSGVVANPGDVGFGAHDVGVASSPSEVSIINCSAMPLTVSTMGVTGTDAGAFQISGTTPITIPVGGDAPWNVVFTAQHAGMHSGTLELHNDGATDPIQVTLTGTGNAATGGDGGLDGGNGEDTTSYYACACRSSGHPSGAVPIVFAFLWAVRRRRR